MDNADLENDPIATASTLLRQNGSAADVLAAIAAISSSDSRFPQAQHVRAQCALRDGDAASAKALLLDVIARDDTRLGPWISLARTAAALDAPDDIMAKLEKLLPRIPPQNFARFVKQLLSALNFTAKTISVAKNSALDRVLLPALSFALENDNMDAAIEIEAFAYTHYLKSKEEEEHFSEYMAKITPLFSHSADHWRKILPPTPHVELRAPYKVAFFVHIASTLAHIEVMLNTLKGFRSLPEPPFTVVVYCFIGRDQQMESLITELGVELVMLEERFPETGASQWQRLLKFRDLLAEDQVHELVWVSAVLMMPLVFGIRFAPVQTWWAMKYRNYSLDSIDGYVSGSAITRFATLHGRRWRMGMLGVDDWIDASQANDAAALRAPFENKLILLTLGRTEKLQNPIYLNTIVSILRSNPDVVFLWAGREENAIVHHAFEAGGVLEQTHFIGWVDTRLYAQVADVFLDSFPFPCGFTLFQAMAAGKPVVIYTSPEAAQTGLWSFLRPAVDDGEGAAEELAELRTFIGEGDHPLISIARTPEDYISLTQRLISDAAARHAAGDASKRFIARYFSDPAVMGRSFARHFVELIEERQDGHPRNSTTPVLYVP